MAAVTDLLSAVTGPRDLPRLAAFLHHICRPGGPVADAEIQRALAEMGGAANGVTPDLLEHVMAMAVRAGKQNTAWMHHHVAEASLWWCSAEMTDVVCEAAVDMPGDFTLENLTIGHPVGMVVFGRPVIGTDASDGQLSVRVDGILWGPTVLPPRDEPHRVIDREDGVPAISFVALRRFTPETDPHFAEAGWTDCEGKEVWVPIGRTDWPIGDRIDHPSHVALSETAWLSMQEDRRLMAALWTIAATPTVVERTREYAPRADARRIARTSKSATAVEVVHLRREVPTGRDAEVAEHEQSDTTRTRHLSVRFLVRAHLRWQACGPERKDRRLIVVPPHVKGPDGAPMVRRPRVWSLDR